MRNLLKIFLRQSKIFLIIPLLIVTVTLIHSKVFEKKKQNVKLMEAKFTWELSKIDTRGIKVRDDYLISKISLVDPTIIEKYYNRYRWFHKRSQRRKLRSIMMIG